MTTTNLPVLFLTDLVVLPGMVVPIELDDAARAAVDAARSHSDGKLLVAPRLDDRYASFGVVADIVQLGRLQNGDPAAVIKADRRVRIGSGVSGPGTALWIEVTELDEQPVTDDVRALAVEYKQVTIATLQRRVALDQFQHLVADAGHHGVGGLVGRLRPRRGTRHGQRAQRTGTAAGDIGDGVSVGDAIGSFVFVNDG